MSAFVGAVISGCTVTLLIWVAKLLWRITVDLRKVSDAIFPEEKPSLPDQVSKIQNDVSMLRITGTDRLREILEEARVIRRHVNGDDS